VPTEYDRPARASSRRPQALRQGARGAGPASASSSSRAAYRVTFRLGSDPAAYTGIARLLEGVRHWRATEVYQDGALVSAFHAREMAWCASSQLAWFGECRFRFFCGVPPRCSLCPLFDVERAVRDVLGENTPNMIEIRLPRLEALLAGEPLPPLIAPPLDPNWRIPDRPPEEWWQDLGDAEPSD
jgi:hypothetical protein